MFVRAFLHDFVAAHDSELVSRLKRAGLIVVGKTNTPEFGILPTAEHRYRPKLPRVGRAWGSTRECHQETSTHT